MIKPGIASDCTKVGTSALICPKCGKLSSMPVFSAKTSVNIVSIEVHELHNKHFAVCTGCNSTFEVSK